MTVSAARVASLLAKLPDQEQRAWLRLLEIRGRAQQESAPVGGATVHRLPDGRLVVDAPEWRPGPLDREEIYADDEP